jgi:amidohydrolase
MDRDFLQQKLERYFKWFHQHPEPGNGEIETTARIGEILNEAGIEVLDAGLKTGLAARITGGGGTRAAVPAGGEVLSAPVRAGASPGAEAGKPVIALRCDIDALPVTECSGLAYASQKPGFMHACGHDFHLTAMLGAALLLSEEREKFAGTVKLLFQPAEEGGGGAKQALDTGVLDDVDEIYGLHVSAEHESGVIGVSPGPTHAAVGAFKIIINGKGGHAAHPQDTLDPIPATAALVSAAQTIVSRNTDPFDQSVLSFTHAEAGSTWNVIPETALLEGTFRAFTDEKLARIARRLEEVCRGAAESFGLGVNFSWTMYTSATNNDPALSEFTAQTARSLGLAVIPTARSMGGEDFALYQKRIPGVFWTIGVGSPQGVHHPGFIADPAPLSSASRLLAALAVKGLERLFVHTEGV